MDYSPNHLLESTISQEINDRFILDPPKTGFKRLTQSGWHKLCTIDGGLTSSERDLLLERFFDVYVKDNPKRDPMVGTSDVFVKLYYQGEELTDKAALRDGYQFMGYIRFNSDTVEIIEKNPHYVNHPILADFISEYRKRTEKTPRGVIYLPTFVQSSIDPLLYERDPNSRRVFLK